MTLTATAAELWRADYTYVEENHVRRVEKRTTALGEENVRLEAVSYTHLRDYLYLDIMPEESRNAAFYEKHGFRVMEDGVAMQLCNFSNRS